MTNITINPDGWYLVEYVCPDCGDRKYKARTKGLNRSYPVTRCHKCCRYMTINKSWNDGEKGSSAVLDRAKLSFDTIQNLDELELYLMRSMCSSILSDRKCNLSVHCCIENVSGISGFIEWIKPYFEEHGIILMPLSGDSTKACFVWYVRRNLAWCYLYIHTYNKYSAWKNHSTKRIYTFRKRWPGSYFQHPLSLEQEWTNRSSW